MRSETLVLRTVAVDGTQAVARAITDVVAPGDVVVLAGELGAGKTAFVQGFGAGLGIDETITSPTFTIVREYDSGRLGLRHLDVYRLDHLHEVLDLGISEMLDEGAVVVVEWGEAILPTLPAEHLEVRLTFGAGDDERRIEIRPIGPSWAARHRRLCELLEPWTDTGGESC